MTQHPKRERALALYNAKTPVQQIIAELGISTSSLYRWVREHQLATRYRVSSQGTALNDEQVRAAVDAYTAGQSIQEVASAHNISFSTMRRLLASRVPLRRYTHHPRTTAPTELQARVRSMVEGGMTRRQVAEQLGLSLGHVYRIVPAERHANVSNVRATIIEYHLANPQASIQDTANACGVSYSVVKHALRSAGLRGHNCRGPNPARIAEAQRLYDANMPMAAVAAQIGCSEHFLQRHLKTRSRSEAAKIAWAQRRQNGDTANAA